MDFTIYSRALFVLSFFSMSDLVFSKAYFDCLMTPGGSSALTTSSKKDLLTNLSSVKDDKLTINRNTITSPEEMYRAFVEWFRR